MVIADDFTGALDTGVQFSKKGVPVLVLTAARFVGGLDGAAASSEAKVLVVDTESRHLPSGEAKDVVVRVVRDAWKNGFRRFYKKTDSALRGNIGAELSGLLEAVDFPRPCLTFVPAFPKSRRVTRGGVHYIDGVEAALSVFSKDPFTPVTRSAVADVIHLQTDIPTENITSDAYEKAALRPQLEKIIRILDAETMDDIEAMGRHLKRGDNLDLLAGCAGFAEILPELLELPGREMKWERSGDCLLVVSGSVNPISVEQTALGEALGFSTISLSLEQKLNECYSHSAECADFVQRVADALLRNKRVLIRTVESTAKAELVAEYASVLGLAENEIPFRVASNIGEITLQIVNVARVENLAVFGGDTLHVVLSKMGCRGVVPLVEIAPGVVAAKVLCDHYDGLVITKSGGLGEKDVLRQICEFISGGALTPN